MSGLLSLFRRRSDAKAPAPVEATAEDLVREGSAHLEGGRFLPACHAFEQALKLAPGDAAVRVNLAYALQEAGQAERATAELRRAADLDPASFDARFMLGTALLSSALSDDAVPHLQAAVGLQPAFVPAQVSLCRALVDAGRPDDATAAVVAARAALPDSLDLLLCEGNLHAVAGRHAEALAVFDRALEIAPGTPGLLLNRSIALAGLKRLDDALAAADDALRAQPGAEAHAARARALQALGRHREASDAWRAAVAQRPADAEFVNQLGVSLYAHGALHEAIDCYRRAIALEPGLPGGYANLGLALLDAGDVAAAADMFRTGLAIKPLATLHDNLGIALQKQARFDEAIEHHKLAIALDGDNLNSQCNLASALAHESRPAEAMQRYREILALRPSHLIARSNLLFHMSVDRHTSADAYLEEARRFDTAAIEAGIPAFVAPADRRPGPIRIGFVSGDLRAHPVGYFLEGILRHLDAARFELHAYPTSVHEDALTGQLKSRFLGWRQLKGVSDTEAVEAIRGDGIDVLFDLAGHTGDNRLGVFAARAAPLQVTWLGYFASTGVAAIDYVLADDVCVPVGGESAFTERVWRLPDTRLCFTPPRDGSVPDVSPSPAGPTGHVTFGCFQRLTKVSDELLALWRRILDAVPNARLFLLSPQLATASGVADILQRLDAAGIDRRRVTTAPPRARAEYLQAYAQVDIVLDTFPYTGGTTTCEALWMGVPTVTRDGDSMIARQGVAMLGAVGLHDWIGADDDGYVATAVRQASDVPALASLRASLRARAQGSALFNVARFARRFEAAIDGMRAEHGRSAGTGPR